MLEYAFVHYCTPIEKLKLQQEFYGREYALFKGELVKFEDILAKNPEKKSQIMKNLEDMWFKLSDKPDNLVHSVLHKPMLNYLQNADYTSKLEFISNFKAHLLRFLHSKPGAKAAALCIAYGTAKIRKAQIKSFKTFVPRICKERYGHLVILALLRYVDDTTILSNQILKPMFSDPKTTIELMFDKYGSRCILAALGCISKEYLSPQTLAFLDTVMVPDPSDATKLIPSCKKDFATKVKDFQSETVAAFSSFDKKKIRQAAKHKFGWVILYEIIQRVEPEVKEIIYSFLLDSILPKKDNDILRNTYACLLLEKLVKDDTFKQELLWKIQHKLSIYVSRSPACFVIEKLLNIPSTQEKLLPLLHSKILKCLPWRAKIAGVDSLCKSYERITGTTLPEYVDPNADPQTETKKDSDDEDNEDNEDSDKDSDNDSDDDSDDDNGEKKKDKDNHQKGNDEDTDDEEKIAQDNEAKDQDDDEDRDSLEDSENEITNTDGDVADAE